MMSESCPVSISSKIQADEGLHEVEGWDDIFIGEPEVLVTKLVS